MRKLLFGCALVLPQISRQDQLCEPDPAFDLRYAQQWHPGMRRKVIAELLDDDLGTAAEIAASLADLRHINDWFGGTRTTIALLRRVVSETACRQLSVLEVGAGAGHVPLAAQRALAREDLELRITLMDRAWSHLPAEGAALVVGDVLQLPFRDDAFDVVSCSLLAHHFEPDGLQLFGRESLRVCRRAVLINDLIRSRLHLGLVYLGLLLFRSRITWHDAPASVRRAYTQDEMRELLSRLPAQRIEMSKHYLYRMGALAWK
jgi:SAM-dependent methyltransferase